MGLSADGYIALIWALSAVILVAMTLYALACGWYFRRSNTTQENFITARGQVGSAAGSRNGLPGVGPYTLGGVRGGGAPPAVQQGLCGGQEGRD